MPLPKKVQKADIVHAALKISETEPLDSLTARRLAQELNCSVQPIFYNFATMDELKAAALDTMYQIYLDYMNEGSESAHPYKGMGLAYIRFARDYPSYFKHLFMTRTNHNLETFIAQDTADDKLLQCGAKFSGLSLDTQKQFHLKVAVFTHGLATLVATGTVQITDAEVDALLTHTVHELLVGHKQLTTAEPAQPTKAESTQSTKVEPTQSANTEPAQLTEERKNA